MTERKRDFLTNEFRDGERPSGTDFADLIESVINKASDGVSMDSDGNLVLSRGVKLGNSNGTAAGGLRFAAGQVQFFDGTNWLPLSSGGGGAFQPIVATPPATAPVAYGGQVGIGAFTTASPPTFRFEVNLAPNTATTEQVRFGTAVVANGSAAFGGFANFSHQSHASNTNFALRQSPNGATHVNAAAGQVVSIRQGGTTVRLGVSVNGNVIVGGETDLAGAPAGSILQCGGGAFKNDGSANWAFTSDARVKEDVRDLEVGLSELQKVRPVRYRYNGRAGTPAGLAGVGIVGQEIESVFPETIRRVDSGAGEPGLEGLRVFDPSALTYVLINAVKELAAKVARLEQELAATP